MPVGDKRTRNWLFVIYPESAPEDWRRLLRDEGVPCAVSPLHDKDANPNGDPKKSHWHVILSFSGVKTQRQVKEITDKLNAPLPQACKDIRGACRYLCHMDNPEKAQYDVAGIECMNGFDFVSKVGSSADVDESIREMMAWCMENECDSFFRLSNYAAENRPDWFRVITTKRTVFLSAWLKSMTWELRRESQR